MLKNILNLEGAQQLSKSEQNTINGGYNCSLQENYCKNRFGYGYICINGTCSND